MEHHAIAPWAPFIWGGVWIVFWLVIIVLRSRERTRVYGLIEKAMQTGMTIPPELWARVGGRGWTGFSELRSGLIWTAAGVGLFAGGIVNYYTYTGPHPILFYGPYGFFPIPLAIGLAFLLMAYIRREKR